MNAVNKLNSLYDTSSMIVKEDDKYIKSKSNFNKNYNEKIYIYNDTLKNNKNQICEKHKNRILKESIIPELSTEHLEKNNEYFTSNEDKQGGIPINFLDKLKGSTVKVNLNISNNYYNSNNNFYQEKNEKLKNQKKRSQENSKLISEKLSQPPVSENLPTRLTVFIKNLFFGNETDKKETKHEFNIKSSYNKKPLIPTTENKELLYINCQNCYTMVKLEEIDKHSNVCVKVKFEVYQSEIQNKEDAVNYKLKKLHDNLIKIKSNSNMEKNENYYIDILIETISNCLKMHNPSEENLEHLNKLLVNMEFKGSFASQVLLERAKILIKEKMKTLRNSIRSSIKDRFNFKERLTHLKKVKDEKLHEAKRLTIEKENLQYKINNFQGYPGEKIKSRKGTNLKPRNFKFLQEYLLKESDDSTQHEFENFILESRNSRINLSHSPRHILDDINSDIEDERTSQFSYKTEQSSIYSSNETGLDKLDTTLNLTLENHNGKIQEMRKSFSNNLDPKEMKNLYREFVKLVLKVKFEVFNSNHPGQKISERILFNECLSKQILKNKFREFIINELNKPEKYLKCFKSAAKARKTKININKRMDIIKEESF